MNNRNLYFIENIIPTSNFQNSKDKKSIIVLLDASKKSNIYSGSNNYNYRIITVKNNNCKNCHEGQYVKYQNGLFTNGSTTSNARRNVCYDNYFRGKLKKMLKYTAEEPIIPLEVKIYSYHINVGHGNCSIIVIVSQFKTFLWMVDCSDYDFTNHRSYIVNITSCFNHIATKFHITDLKINKFFLTHFHFDHYSGLVRLIDLGIITAKTVFYLNVHYPMPNENSSRLLQRIHSLAPLVIEPLSTIRTSNLHIWHPTIRTIRKMTDCYRHQQVIIESQPNNSSVLYHFIFNRLSMLFTGDLETTKWDTISCCPLYMQRATYFIIPHHGSENGFLRNTCPRGRSIINMATCLLPTSTAILMGRNGSFNGIYSNQVLSAWSNLVLSEYDRNQNMQHFIEIDWQTNTILSY